MALRPAGVWTELLLGNENVGTVAGCLPAISSRLKDDPLVSEKSQGGHPTHPADEGGRLGGATKWLQTATDVDNGGFPEATLTGHNGNILLIHPRRINCLAGELHKFHEVTKPLRETPVVSLNSSQQHPNSRFCLNNKHHPGVISRQLHGHQG